MMLKCPKHMILRPFFHGTGTSSMYMRGLSGSSVPIQVISRTYKILHCRHGWLSNHPDTGIGPLIGKMSPRLLSGTPSLDSAATVMKRTLSPSMDTV